MISTSNAIRYRHNFMLNVEKIELSLQCKQRIRVICGSFISISIGIFHSAVLHILICHGSECTTCDDLPLEKID